MASTPRNAILHPSGLTPSTLSSTTYDVILVGSGPAGRALAGRTAAAGLSTLCVEEELLGGECPYWACMPSKALLRPGEVLELARQISGVKELIQNDNKTKTRVDVKAVFARRDRFTQNWDDQGWVERVSSQKIDIVRGTANLTENDKEVDIVNVNGERTSVVARQAVVLATGSAPVIPDIPGLQELDFWTPRHATAANEVPKHLVILGGGVVGCEMATAYSSFGAKVTLITSSDRLLPRFEPEASRRVQAALEASGVTVIVQTNVKAFTKKTGQEFEALLQPSGAKIVGTTLLIATGRKPRTEGIGLEKIGALDPLNLQMDDSLCVTTGNSPAKWLYVVGDANKRQPLTHRGEYQARAAALTIIARARGQNPTIAPWSDFAATADHDVPTQVVVTDPNVASTGLTLAEAIKKGLKVKEVAVPFAFPGAWVHAEFNYDGWAQWAVDTERNLLVGATFVGREAADLVHASTVAIVGQVPIDRLWHAVPSFPTMSEIYSQLLLAFEASGE